MFRVKKVLCNLRRLPEKLQHKISTEEDEGGGPEIFHPADHIRAEERAEDQQGYAGEECPTAPASSAGEDGDEEEGDAKPEEEEAAVVHAGKLIERGDGAQRKQNTGRDDRPPATRIGGIDPDETEADAGEEYKSAVWFKRVRQEGRRGKPDQCERGERRPPVVAVFDEQIEEEQTDQAPDGSPENSADVRDDVQVFEKDQHAAEHHQDSDP